MESLETIRRQVQAAEDLRSVVTTMKALAAVGIRRYERAADALAGYDRTVRLGLHAVLRGVAAGRVGVDEDESGEAAGPVAAVAFGSDQGMCGQLNDRVAERTAEVLGESRGETVLLASGARAASLLEARGFEVDATFGTPSSLEGVGPAVDDLLSAVERVRVERDAASIRLVFPRRTAGASHEVRTRRILPLDRRWLEALRRSPWPTRCLPTWSGTRAGALGALVREYLFVALFRAQVDALSSEHASRLASMQAAERNVAERLEDLRAVHRRQRQALIMSELLDVIAGFEALSEADPDDGAA